MIIQPTNQEAAEILNPNLLDKSRDYNKLFETYRITEDIINQLTPEATLQLWDSVGGEQDIDKLFDLIADESYQVLYGQTIDRKAIQSNQLGYLDKLSESVNETLCCENLNYFITSMLPDFEMNWHHVQWGEIAMKHDKFCILAARDHGKSVCINTPIRMFDGSIKLAKDIKIGDKLMGADSTMRIVKNVGRSWDDNMYKISQHRGNDYTVNSRHTLTLLKKVYKYNSKGNTCGYDLKIVDIDIQDYLKLSKYQRETMYYGFKVCTEFKQKKVSLNPYYLGLWLGDGNSHDQNITNIDKEANDFCETFAKENGLNYKYDYSKVNRLNADQGKPNIISKKLRSLNVLNNKHIPEIYLRNSKRVRLELLAGLIDSDGNLHDGCYYIGQVNKRLAKEIQQLAHGLGFHATFRQKDEQIQWLKSEDKSYTSYEVCITGSLHIIPVKIKRKKVPYFDKQNHKHLPIIDGYELTVKSPLKVENVGRGEYVSITVDGDERFLLGDNTVTHNSYMFSMAYPVWQLYRFKPKNNTTTEQKNKRGFLFSFSVLQAIDLLAILKENIEDIDVLKERLYNRDNWSKTDITCKNRARLTTKGFGSAARGAHPGWIIVDDGLKDNVIYSAVQRQKNIDYFHAVIMNMVVPGGQVGVVGTPFHNQDLYGDLKTKPNWFVYEFPSIFPNGDILWANRWKYSDLMEKRKSQGNLIFSRELLCRPITSDSTIFPIEILNNAFLRMEDVVLVDNRESYKKKFDKVVVGCDFAISSSVGADYSVFGVWGIDDKERMWLMHFWRKKGASYAEQLAKLKSINANFRPNLMMLEKNQMQQIFVEGAEKENLPVKGHTTGTQKNDLRKGLPGLAIMFERGMFKIPQGNQYSKDVGDLFVMEFSSVAFTDKGLMATDGHDDVALMSWISVECARNITANEFKFDFV